MIFQTQYTGSKAKPEINSGEILVDVAGYYPAQTRIENLILAGHRLVESRRSQYDTELQNTSEDKLQIDPTRRKDFDMAEASQIAISLEQMAIRKHDEKRRMEEALKASQNALEAPEGASKQKTDPE